MSSVRMCDKCGRIFSEREDGWQTFTAATIKRVKGSGRQVTVEESLDACPVCAFHTDEESEIPVPRLNGATKTVDATDTNTATSS